MAKAALVSRTQSKITAHAFETLRSSSKASVNAISKSQGVVPVSGATDPARSVN